MKTAPGPSTRGRRRTLRLWLLIGLGLGGTRPALATEYYVAPTGSDSNPGTIDQPFGSVQKGADTALAGDIVYLRGGTYAITTPKTSGAGLLFSKSGTSDTNRIKYFAYPGEVPLLDFTNLKISTSGYTMGVSVTGSWLHFKGIEECCVPMNTYSNNGFAVDGGSNDIFESLNMHHNSGNGIFIGKGSGGHLVLNCDAHDNYDATSNQGQGQNADGFGVHYQTSGATTILRGCRAWWNSDDGYDLINQEVPVIVENSWAVVNGYADYGNTNPSSGNGNGFKMGSSKNGVRHLVQNNVAWKNKASGFYANHSSGGNTWYNNTSYSNGTQYNMLASPPDDPNTTITLTGSLAHIMRNNIGFPNKNTNMTGVDTQFNTWDLNITPAAKDFLSVTDASMTVKDVSVEASGALGPRPADGGLPKVDFLKLVTGSAMIDKGTDVELPFVGAAPDLGAYEFGAAGGSTGAGGAGTGGNGTGGPPVSAGGAGGVTSGGSGAGGAPTSAGAAFASGGAVVGAGGNSEAGGDATMVGTVNAGGGPTGNGTAGVGTEVASSSGRGSSPDAGSCGCRVSGLPSRSGPLTGVALLGLLLLRARRRKERQPSSFMAVRTLGKLWNGAPKTMFDFFARL